MSGRTSAGVPKPAAHVPGPLRFLDLPVAQLLLSC
jgi:hypothetical protein